MIFLAGIHGAGKTTFCKRVENQLGAKCYSASGLIEAVMRQKMPENKEIRNIEQNQRLLEYAVRMMGRSCESILMEGHLCLLNKEGEIVRIPQNTFEKLKVQRIFVLTDEVSVIARRNEQRSSLLASPDFIARFQGDELAYGEELCEAMGIPFHVIENTESGFHGFLQIWEEMQKS